MVYRDECALTKAVILVIDMVRVFEAFKTIPVSCAWNTTVWQPKMMNKRRRCENRLTAKIVCDTETFLDLLYGLKAS